MALIIIDNGHEKSEFECKEHENILSKALEEGVSLPFACMNGTCTTCKVQLVEGQVHMDQTLGIQDEIDSGAVLTCQAYPRTAEVHLKVD